MSQFVNAPAWDDMLQGDVLLEVPIVDLPPPAESTFRAEPDGFITSPLYVPVPPVGSNAPCIEPRLGSFRDDVRRVWCCGPKAVYSKPGQRFNLACRCLPLVRRNVDIIVLPGERPGFEVHGVAEFAAFMTQQLNLAPWQILTTNGKSFHMDDDVDEAICTAIVETIQASPAGTAWQMVPYMVSHEFMRWGQCIYANPLLAAYEVTVCGELQSFIAQWGTKEILHRHISAPGVPSGLERVLQDNWEDRPGREGAPVPRGYTCDTTAELATAYHRLLDEMKADGECRQLKYQVLIKPVHGSAGAGIVFVNEENVDVIYTYDFAMGRVVLEEFLDLDLDDAGEPVSPCVHYMGPHIVGELIEQIMLGTSYEGWRRSGVSPAFRAECGRLIQRLLDVTGPFGPGGVDFLSLKGRPLLTDINTCRFNGAHFPKLFLKNVEQATGRKLEFHCWRDRPLALSEIGLDAWWQEILRAGLQMDHEGGLARGGGVFPCVYMKGLMVQLIAVADTYEECLEMQRKCDVISTKMLEG